MYLPMIVFENYLFQFLQIVTLDFENFTSQRPNAPITSVSPMPYNPLPGAASQDPVSTSPPENEDPIQDFLAAERYLRDQIKELDAQFNALNEAYQQGKRERQRYRERERETGTEREREYFSFQTVLQNMVPCLMSLHFIAPFSFHQRFASNE